MTYSKRLYANNAKSTLVRSISPSDTVIEVSDGSSFPNPATGEYFLITIEASGNIEIVQVTGRSGNIFTGCLRAQEGTIANNFPSAAKVDNRVTRGTLESFARLVDRIDNLSSIESLTTPVTSNSNSYLCVSPDDEGNPILASRETDSKWRFNTHKLTMVNGAASSGTTTTLTSTDISTKIRSVSPGRFIIQFTSGSNLGSLRFLSSSGTNTVSWNTALINPVANTDQFEIYQSDASIIRSLLDASEDSLIYAILLSE